MNTRFLSVIALTAALGLPFSAMAQDNTSSNDTTVTFVARDTASADADQSASKDETAKVEEAKADDKVAEAAKDSEDAADSDDEEDNDRDWSVGAAMTIDLGIGAFVKNEYARKVRSRLAFSVHGSYTIPVIDVDVHAETGFSAWLSTAGGTNGKHEFRWADSEIGLSRSIWAYKSGDFAVAFDADLSFTLPTSTASIHDNLYTAITPSLSAALKFARLSFTYGIAYSHSFHEYTSATEDPTEVDIISRSTGVELLGTHDVAVDGVLTEIELVNQFSIGIRLIDELNLALGFGFSDSWTYDNGTINKNDEYVNKNAKVGRGHSQTSLGTLALAYTALKSKDYGNLTVSLSMASMQPWKSKDNKTIRFPWIDTVTPAKNFTKFIVGVAYEY